MPERKTVVSASSGLPMAMSERLSATLQEERAYWQEQLEQTTRQHQGRTRTLWRRQVRHAFTMEEEALDSLKQADQARQADDFEVASILTERAVRHLCVVLAQWNSTLSEIAQGTPLDSYTLTKGERGKKKRRSVPQTGTPQPHQPEEALVQRIYLIRACLCALLAEINECQWNRACSQGVQAAEQGKETKGKEEHPHD